MKRFLFLILALPFLLQQYPLVAQTVSGVVFHDKNGNKLQDSGEPGLSGVAVSDQVNVVLTDQEGRFRLETSDRFNTVFISLPDGYQGNFWQVKAAELSFPLQAVKVPRSFRFIHASDTHADSLNLPRMARFREMADSIGAAFVIVSGDLVRDALRVTEPVARAYYEMYLREIGKFSMPVFSGVGNHEL
nr:metallophosphoesterase N-terminal domain-containing protein [Flavilitoribacter sp.]